MDICEALVEHLLDEGCVSQDALTQIQALVEGQAQDSKADWLMRLGLVSESRIAHGWATALGLRRFDYAVFRAPDSPSSLLPIRFLSHHCVVPVGMTADGCLELVIARPEDHYPVRAVEYATGLEVLPLIGTRTEVEQVIEMVYGQGRSTMGTLVEQFESLEGPESVDHLKDLASEAPVIRLVNLILQRATEMHASDVHFEPFESRLTIRYRVDGLLREVESPPVRSAAAVISRIKIMARLDIAERRLPQDGRIALRLLGRQVGVFAEVCG